MKKIYIALTALTLTVASCSDSYLDEAPYSSYTSDAITDQLGIDASIVGIQNSFSNIYTKSDRQGWLSVWQVGTDVATAGGYESIEVPYYNYEKLTATDLGASSIWSLCYSVINNSNILIDNLEQNSLPSVTEANKNKALGEAKFFRAYCYNMLATLFGDIPLQEHAVSSAKTDYTRTPLAQVNDFIIKDLIFGSDNLPDIDDVASNTGGKMYSHANKYMAMQLLGEVYLRMNDGAKAEATLKKVISSGKFSLVKSRFGKDKSKDGDYYHDMFIYGNQRRGQGNTEAIWTFEVENPSTVTGGYTGAPQHRRVWGAAYHNVSGMVLCDSLGGRGLGRLRLSSWLTKSLYKDGDIRNSKYNIHRDFYYNDPKNAKFGQKIPFQGADTLYWICPSTTKWYCFDEKDTYGWASVKDWPMMRLGETYLLLAEAQFQQGHLEDAAGSINELRKRAYVNYPMQGEVFASDITLNFILDERARELIGEENRRMTLMRTKTLVNRAKLNCDLKNPITGLTDKNLLLPIPLSEIQLNKDAKLEQNPGYTN